MFYSNKRGTLFSPLKRTLQPCNVTADRTCNSRNEKKKSEQTMVCESLFLPKEINITSFLHPTPMMHACGK